MCGVYERTIGCQRTLISTFCRGAMPRMQRSFWMLMHQLQFFTKVCYHRMTRILTLFLVALPHSTWTIFWLAWQTHAMATQFQACPSKPREQRNQRRTSAQSLYSTGGRVDRQWQSKKFRHLICSQHSCGKRAEKSHSWANLYTIWRCDLLVDIRRFFPLRICLRHASFVSSRDVAFLADRPEVFIKRDVGHTCEDFLDKHDNT